MITFTIQCKFRVYSNRQSGGWNIYALVLLIFLFIICISYSLSWLIIKNIQLSQQTEHSRINNMRTINFASSRAFHLFSENNIRTIKLAYKSTVFDILTASNDSFCFAVAKQPSNSMKFYPTLRYLSERVAYL